MSGSTAFDSLIRFVMQGVNDYIERLLHMNRRWYERLAFIVTFGIMVLFVPPTIDLFAIAWASGGITAVLIDAFGQQYVLLVVASVVSGIFLTLLFDSYKRIFGLLLGLIIIANLYANPRVPLLNFFGELSLQLAGVGVGITVGTAYLLGVKWSELKRSRAPFKFPRAPKVLFVAAILLVPLGIVEAYFNYGMMVVCITSGTCLRLQFLSAADTLLEHLVAGGLVVGLIGYYARYEDVTRVMIIGPQRSGKSAAIGGMAMTAGYLGRKQEGRIDTRGYINVIVEDYLREGEWPPPNKPGGDETKLLQFNYHYGLVFPKDLAIQTVDYPGDLLEDIVKPLLRDQPHRRSVHDAENSNADGTQEHKSSTSGSGESPDFEEIFGDGDDDTADQPTSTNETDTLQPTSWEDAIQALRLNPGKDKARSALRNCIIDADKLILTVPLDDFMDRAKENDTDPEYWDPSIERMDASTYIRLYRELVQTYPDKRFVLAVTMADLAEEDFFETEGEKRPHKKYQKYQTHIKNEFLDTSIEELLYVAEERNVYPVWFNIETRTDDEDNTQAYPSVTARPLRGAQQLLDRIAS